MCFRRFSTEDGLSQTHINAILQDDQGFMWLASMYGLKRYDGYKFKVFKHELGNPSSLSGVHNYSLFKDHSVMLWIGCEEFLDKFDPVTETATHYRVGSRDGEAFPVAHISQDRAGMLWLATESSTHEEAKCIHSNSNMNRKAHTPSSGLSSGAYEGKCSK